MTADQLVALLTLLADLRMQIAEQASVIADLKSRIRQQGDQ